MTQEHRQPDSDSTQPQHPERLSDGHPGKLSAAQRAAISVDPRCSRELAQVYGVHHSRICAIKQEAQAALTEYWQAKRPGRKPKAAPEDQSPQLQERLAEQTQRADFLDMQNDWLRLQLEWAAKRAEKEESDHQQSSDNRTPAPSKKKAKRRKARAKKRRSST